MVCRVITLVGGTALLCAALRLAAVQVLASDTAAGGDARPVKQQLVGSGKWQSQRNGNDSNWHIQLKRLDDDSLSGRITVVGSPLVQQARIEGQISGTEVYGVIVGENDIQVATFTGAIFKDGMSGTYTTSDGDSGSWSWERPEPDAVTSDKWQVTSGEPASESETAAETQ